jgi:predicted PurR-regulated permease PerM
MDPCQGSPEPFRHFPARRQDQAAPAHLLNRFPARYAVFGAAAVLGLLLFIFEGEILLGLFAGVLLGVLFWEIATFLEQRLKVHYKAAAAAVLILYFGAWGLGLWLMGAQLAAQLRDLANHLPGQLQSVLAYMKRTPLLRDLLGGATGAHTPSTEQVVSGTATVVSGTVEAIGGLVVAVFIGSYLALDPHTYVKPLLDLSPPAHREKVEQIVARVARTLGRWLLGRLVAMVFVGVVTGVGLLLLKIPMALALGVVAGLLAFIEYVGAIASAVPAVALALTISFTQALWVALLYLGVHVIEGYLLTPMLAKKAVDLPPAYVLASQVIFGVLFGALGLTFSTPLLVVIVVVVQMTLVERSPARQAA